MNQRTAQIMAAMKGRQASAVNDDKLRTDVRFKIEQLAKLQGRELVKSAIESCTNNVIRAAAHTIIFEDEVCIALEMGAAGEFGETEKMLTRENCYKWVNLYAVCEDRSAAQYQISLNAARDRKRIDSISAEEKRRDFQENGLRRAWATFVEDGGWCFMTKGYGAALYDKIGALAVRALLDSGKIAAAKVAAIADLRHDYPRKYRTCQEEEISKDDLDMYWKNRLARTYFETLRERALDITYNPVAI